MITKIFLFVSLLLSVSTWLRGQSVATQQEALPTWVSAIDNPNTNYFETVKTFEDFWKNRVKPLDEMESGEKAKEEEREFKKYVKRLSVAERNYFEQLCYHYKRFKRWQQDVLPFVQDSGRILTQEELNAIWQKQQEAIKTQKR